MRVCDGTLVHRFVGAPLTVQGGTVQWVPDGSGLLYTSAERNNVWLRRLSGGDPVRVTNFTDETIFRFGITADRRLVMSRNIQTRPAFRITGFR